MAGLTLDTGALIALEKRKRNISLALEAAFVSRRRVTVPTAVLVEFGHGELPTRVASDLEAADFESLDKRLALVVARACRELRITSKQSSAGEGPSLVDVIVVASAAERGDTVLTDDPEDLQRIKDNYFPGCGPVRKVR